MFKARKKNEVTYTNHLGLSIHCGPRIRQSFTSRVEESFSFADGTLVHLKCFGQGVVEFYHYVHCDLQTHVYRNSRILWEDMND